MRWRPFEEKKDYGLNEAIADGVDELWQGGAGGDILIFLPGEREIREAADHLRQHLQHYPALRNSEVLPLFSRLSQAEQDRIFDSHSQRRIVLATNVAETSLTVPGIKYVIDAGTARVKRYSFQKQGGAVAGRADQPGRRQPTRRALRARGQRYLHSPVRRGRLQPARLPLPTRKFCAPRWPASSCA